MKLKVVYIAGPYRAKTISGIRANIESARRVAEKYWRAGFAVVCPHLNSAFMDGITDDDFFLQGDMEILRRCDIIVMAPGWKNSRGAKAELETAKKHKMEVFLESLE